MVVILILLLTLGEEDKKEVERTQDQCLVNASKDQFLLLIFLSVCVYMFHNINILKDKQ